MPNSNINTVNIKTLMHKYRDGHHISPPAIKEMKDHIEMWFERNMSELIHIANKHKRKTIFPDDITEFFGRPENEDLQEVEKCQDL